MICLTAGTRHSNLIGIPVRSSLHINILFSSWVLLNSTETLPVNPPLLITAQRETVVKLFVQLREEKYCIMCVDIWLVTFDETEELEDEDEEDFDDDDEEEEE